MHAERLSLLLAVLQMYRLVRKDLRGGRDYVHNIVYHQLGGFCVPDVRTHQARTDGAMRGEAELIRIIPSSDRRRRSQEKVTKTGSNREWQQ